MQGDPVRTVDGSAGGSIKNRRARECRSAENHCVVENNLIGTDLSGTKPFSNAIGVQVTRGDGHEIRGNVISANTRFGIRLQASNVIIDRNTIGRSKDLKIAMPNGQDIEVMAMR